MYTLSTVKKDFESSLSDFKSEDSRVAKSMNSFQSEPIKELPRRNDILQLAVSQPADARINIDDSKLKHPLKSQRDLVNPSKEIPLLIRDDPIQEERKEKMAP